MKTSSTHSACLAMALLTSAAIAAELPVKHTFSVGDRIFGASGKYQYSGTVVGDAVFKSRFDAKAAGTVLRISVPLGSGTSLLQVNRNGKSRAVGSLTLAGLKVANWDKAFASSADFQTAPLFQTQKGGSASFSIGPVSLKLSCNAEVKIYARGSIATTWAASAKLPTIQASVGPALDAAAGAKAQFSVIIAKAGVSASLSITGYGLSGRITMQPLSATASTLTCAVTADTVATNGSISGYIKIGVWIFSKKWSKTFYSYAQPPSSKVLAQTTRRL